MQKQIRVPDEIQAKADQFMANARARFGHGVFRMDANGQGGNQGGSQGGDNGQSGGDQGGSQNQDQGGSILDREAEGGNQGGDGDTGEQGGQGGQGGEGGNVDVNAIVTQVTQALEQRFDSIADRRVNAILREVRGGQQGGGGQQQQGQQGGGDSGQQGGSQQASGPAAGDVREARLVYREYVGDQVRFLGDFEREAASNLAQGLLTQRLAAGDDPETAGREAARQVATTVKGLRKQYESRIMAALRRDGLIPADAGQGGQPLQGPAKPGDQSGYQAGAAKAQQLLAHRMPQQQN